MIATLRWAAPAVLIACTLGCSHEPPPTTKATNPGMAPPKSDATPAASAANMVTMHVEGMT